MTPKSEIQKTILLMGFASKKKKEPQEFMYA